MYNKTKIFNLANVALLISKKITNADTDDNTEALVFRQLWETAIESFLEEADLNETSTKSDLVLVAEDPSDTWLYAYEYPSDCMFLRRIDSGYLKDTKETMVIKQVGIYEGQKVIFTNKEDAVAEYISNEDFLVGLSANGAQALAHKLALFSTPLIANSSDPTKLSDQLEKRYSKYLSLATQKDARENFVPDAPEDESDISRVRFT